MLTRFGTIVGLLVLTLSPATPVWADNVSAPVPGGGIGCGSGGCGIEVGTPGSPGGSDGSGDGDSGGGGSGGESICTYYPVTPSPEEIANLGGQPAGEGGWYFMQCEYQAGLIAGGLVWRATPPPAVTPEQLARMARARLRLPQVTADINPQGQTLTQVPVWLALSGGWASRSATASVPGLSVTATATPSTVRWEMGNGSSKTCSGPGTVYRPGVDDPYASSPTCGFTYTDPVGEGASYTVRATVSYTITWAGGGQSGTLGDLTGSGTTALAVGESQAVVTR